MTPTSPHPLREPAPEARAHLIRIERVLDYIHANLDQPLSLEALARQSCWSRWQLQRVFLHETGQTVAHYVRELKLSMAAEPLLSTRLRVLDVALDHGFGSEVSFSRAFKQQFGCSPLAYRKRGLRLGLRTPLVRAAVPRSASPNLVQVRIESLPAFTLQGVSGTIRGLFDASPDFQQTVPAIWRALRETGALDLSREWLGVVGVSGAGERLPYWAGVTTTAPTPPGLSSLNVPAQEYAVLTHKGPIAQLGESLHWFILHWLPESAYWGLDGFELERYAPGFDGQQPDATMEYWLPVAPR
ncbi:AraC family transcriptional regulator [Aeromonas caviae]|uniref:AraC family transcriptional regulator n=1 Tax=Aeromonas caviae TaxID=648 RepID=UPI0029D6C681|nr:AraC family transcriptional regulator [Aeromonas caviae]MDX7918297.1 AraC family transcriptional regulator [Aeromonas caviae]